MTNEEAIRILESMKSEMLLSFDHDRKEALKLAISALQAQDSKTIRICDTCKHDPPEMDKWPCMDCDMREPADRWEAKDVPDINLSQGGRRMTAKEAKQRLERIWKDYTSAYDTVSIEDLMAFDMATNALGAIDQIQWERDLAIKQLHDLGYGLGEKPREEVKKSNVGDMISKQAAIDLAHELIVPNEYKYGLYNQAINNYCVEIMNLPSAQPEHEYTMEEYMCGQDMGNPEDGSL